MVSYLSVYLCASLRGTLLACMSCLRVRSIFGWSASVPQVPARAFACVCFTVAFVRSLTDSASRALGLLVRCLRASDTQPFAFFLSCGDTVRASWECCQLAD